jgi:alkaline phosphatase D
MLIKVKNKLVALDRRTLLQGLAAASLASAAWAQDAALAFPFTLGVASGDPAPDGFALWTRLAPKPLEPKGGMSSKRYDVAWEVASDEAFKTIVGKGVEKARPELAHSVHAEVSGLMPARPYWYRFHAEGHVSPIGRTRTAPIAGAPLKHAAFAAVGCQHYEQGLYTAYKRLAEEDLDFVFHYGDYIYEAPNWSGGPPTVRRQPGGEAMGLDEYRALYATYKSDSDLQAAHASAPFFVTYDDHEVSNNWVSDLDQYNSPPDAFVLRRAMAMQAWYEHMPLRAAQRPTPIGVQMFRRAQYGDLINAHFLDTRQFRSDQPCGDGFKPACDAQSAAAAQVMGAAEEQWLYDGLKKPAKWNLIAQQVMMLPLNRSKDAKAPPVYNMDSWAGYLSPRQRLLNTLDQMKLGNVVAVAGDEHQNYAQELRLAVGDPKSPIAAHEIVGTSITSGGDGPGARPETPTILSENPDCHLICDKRGYTRFDVTAKEWRTTFKILDKVSTPDGKMSVLATYVARQGGAPMQKA